MIGRSAILIALGAALSAAGALAADPPPPPSKQRLICRGAMRTLGSHIRTARRCRTAEQWQEEDQAKGRQPLSLQVTGGQNDGRRSPTPQ
ncbi:MAG TPA: hypothetical protein VEW71_00415 [Allosphingosinicella sp.]|nr:hypothetical protein [Allosphingosinicella sp.]